jgi:opacity protein-like surface antigen
MTITKIRGALGAVERVGYAVGVGLLILGTAGTAHAHQSSALHPVPAKATSPGDPDGGGQGHVRLLAYGDPDDGGQVRHF